MARSAQHYFRTTRGVSKPPATAANDGIERHFGNSHAVGLHIHRHRPLQLLSSETDFDLVHTLTKPQFSWVGDVIVRTCRRLPHLSRAPTHMNDLLGGQATHRLLPVA